MNGEPNPNGTGDPAPRPSGPGSDGRRLPPPAFPPGMKRVAMRRKPAAGADDLSSAFISPDDPMPDRSGSVPDDAFISPDEPIQRHAPPKPVGLKEEDFDPDEVVVTGIGDDAHLAPEELALGFDPHVLEVVDKVGKLAEALKRRGEAGLRSTPDMSRFEATLRSYCVGYLAGRRAEEEESGGPPQAM